jgi:beta-N-acetylhexosaminidase
MTSPTLRLFLLILFYLGSSTLSLYSNPAAIDSASLTESILGQMTEEEILGQLFLVGYSSAEPSPLLLEGIRSRGIGGVKIFGWNAEDLNQLYRSILKMQTHSERSRLKLPLIIATDQ